MSLKNSQANRTLWVALSFAMSALLLAACAGAPMRRPGSPPWAIEARCRIDRQDYVLTGCLAAPKDGRPTCSSFWLIPEGEYFGLVVIHHDYVVTAEMSRDNFPPAGTWVEEVTFADDQPEFIPIKGRVYLTKAGAYRRHFSVLIDHLDPNISEEALVRSVTNVLAGRIVFGDR